MKWMLIFAGFSVGMNVFAQKKEGFVFVDKPESKEIELFFNGDLLTSYVYRDSLMKPVLFPLKTVSGITVTRGFPIDPQPGERVDHPHHIGLWLNYESVNGLDFWNNSTAIPYERRAHYGSIVHDKVAKKSATKDKASLEVTAQWKRKDGMPLLIEHTQYHFSIQDSSFIVDRTTTLRALLLEEVVFKDIKDGLLGIRVARELELPSDDAAVYIDSAGNRTEHIVNKERANGMYLSSEGLTGNDVWGTRGKWVTLQGVKEKKNVSVTIIDHPENPGYPAYWHARGYGLFAVNPLGQEVFSKGKEKINLALRRGEAVTFRYRVVIHEGQPLSSEQIDKLALSFRMN